MEDQNHDDIVEDINRLFLTSAQLYGDDCMQYIRVMFNKKRYQEIALHMQLLVNRIGAAIEIAKKFHMVLLAQKNLPFKMDKNIKNFLQGAREGIETHDKTFHKKYGFRFYENENNRQEDEKCYDDIIENHFKVTGVKNQTLNEERVTQASHELGELTLHFNLLIDILKKGKRILQDPLPSATKPTELKKRKRIEDPTDPPMLEL